MALKKENWIPTEEDNCGLHGAWITSKIATTIRNHRGSITLQTFEHGLRPVLIEACKQKHGDAILRELLPDSIRHYHIDHLFEYKIIQCLDLPPLEGPDEILHDTLLHITARVDNIAGAALLLKKGAKVNAVNCCGRTALMVSAMCGNIKILKYLIDKGSNVNHQDKFGHTVMILAYYTFNIVI